ncbi:MAG: tartrate-resistant acid phosphatase type 5, partial [Kiritimatiellia bacterium]
YTFKPDKSNVRFIGLDSNAMMFDRDLDEQGAFVDRTVGLADSDYVIAFGHHPYISNGKHGNAGRYEGIPYLPIISGDDVKDFMEDHVCGQVNMYICGHDHNRQWLETTCGTEFIVSGAAAKTTGLEGRGNTSLFEDDSVEGFLWVEIVDRSFTGRFYNLRGEMEYEQTFTF